MGRTTYLSAISAEVEVDAAEIVRLVNSIRLDICHGYEGVRWKGVKRCQCKYSDVVIPLQGRAEPQRYGCHSNSTRKTTAFYEIK